MNHFEAYLVDLLQGNLEYDGIVVPVVKNFNQHPDRPVLTLDLSGGVSTLRVHPYPPDAEKHYIRRSHININVWCDTEQQRESLTGQVLSLFQDEQGYHYKFCTQYNKNTGKCNKTKATCPASENTPKARKNKCPLPREYEYQSLHNSHNLIKGTVNIEPPFDLDEYGEHPPLLRSIMRAEAEYIDVVATEVHRIREVNRDDIQIL